MKKILIVAGARPNFIKISPIIRELKKDKYNFDCKLVHTGQHYDYEMSKIFFEELEIPQPDYFLNVGSDTHAKQTAKIMIEIENVINDYGPDYVLVVGDVNSTLAVSITSKKMFYRVIHVEAGLRSFDMKMPEEINRIITDRVSDLLFVSEKSGIKNLINEGIDEEKIYFVGNVMIDTLLYQLKKLKNDKINIKNHGVLTLHRPSNVDNRDKLQEIFNVLNSISDKMEIYFPVHPRTKKRIKEFGINISNNIKLMEPLGYNDFLRLWKDSKFVITDSGGIQEETTVLGVPCFTLRDSTERPVTIEFGTNTLISNNYEKLNNLIDDVLNNRYKKGKVPEYWDGNASKRIIEVLRNENMD